MQVIVDGLLVHYEMIGEGRTVVLLHGWADRAFGLVKLQAELSKQFKVVTPDLPGFGGSQAPKSAWGLTEYAKFVADFLEKIHIGEIHSFVGHSNGGAIAMRGLGQGILSADKLVLLASAGVRSEYKGRKKALRLLTKTGKVLSSPLPQSTKEKLRSQMYKSVGSDMLVAEHLQETFKKIVSDDVTADAAKITAPTLLLYGENDEQTPVRYGEKFHELLHESTLEILPGAGHFVHLDRPKEVERTIMEFLK